MQFIFRVHSKFYYENNGTDKFTGVSKRLELVQCNVCESIAMVLRPKHMAGTKF